MTAKKKPRGIVYSTDPDYHYDWGDEAEKAELPPGEQDLRVHLLRLKGNRKLTVVKGYRGPADGIEKLGRWLKSACGVGGSVKDGEVMIQGDQREKVMALLKEEGYRVKPSGG
jgi:translation initiation factor 1